MYLASFHYEGHDRIGFRADDGALIDLTAAAAAAGICWTGGEVPADMLALVERSDDLAEPLAVLGRLAAERAMPRIPADAVAWHPPIRRPGKIVGVAMNNSASNDRKISAPDHPMFFLKASTSLIGHGRDIEVRDYYGGLHPEPELAVVIGRRARDLDHLSAS